MKLKLIRRYLKKDYTIGDLCIDDKWFCNTLEHAVRAVNVPEHTAIDFGIYKIDFVYSPLNKRIVPLLQDVPRQRYIEIHIGNSTSDTKGCILVGKNKYIGKVVESTPTFEALMARIGQEKDLTIEITRD